MLSHGTNIETRKAAGAPLLKNVVKGGQTYVAKASTQAGAEYDQGDYYGFALHAAVRHRQAEVVQILLKAGADVHICRGKYNKAV